MSAIATFCLVLTAIGTQAQDPNIKVKDGNLHLNTAENKQACFNMGGKAVCVEELATKLEVKDISDDLQDVKTTLKDQGDNQTEYIHKVASSVEKLKNDTMKTTDNIKTSLQDLVLEINQNSTKLSTSIDGVKEDVDALEKRVGNLEGCTMYQYKTKEGCEDLTDCKLGEYVTKEPTLTSDRVCTVLTRDALKKTCNSKTHFFHDGVCEPIPHEGCNDKSAEQAISPNMVACKMKCSTSARTSRSGDDIINPMWNRYWEQACSDGWHLCYGQEAVSENDHSSDLWNGVYTIFSYSTGNFWGECGSGQRSAFTSTVKGKRVNNDISKTSMHPGAHDFFDGIYGGFIAGRTDFNGNANYYITGDGVGKYTRDRFAHRGWTNIKQCKSVGHGQEGFAVHSKYPSTCSNNFCNTCASGYHAQTEGALCCRGNKK